MLERWVRDVTDKKIRRGSFANIPEVIADIEDYIGHHNVDPKRVIYERILPSRSSKRPDEAHSPSSKHRIDGHHTSAAARQFRAGSRGDLEGLTAVGPGEGLGGFVVGGDVAHEFGDKVFA